MKRYKLAIVGATGVVGRSALQVLEEMKLPISEYKLFASKNSASKKIKFSTENDYNINRFSKLLSNLKIDHDIEVNRKSFYNYIS